MRCELLHAIIPFASALLFCAGTAEADINIAKKPTLNMSCSAGVCTATAKKAILNVGDLMNMLAAGNLTVQTGDGNPTTAGITISYSYGGLTGYTSGAVHNSYSLGGAHVNTEHTRVGGLGGYNVGSISTSYSIGAPIGGYPDNDCQSGGFLGCDNAPAGILSSTYWDLDTSGISDPSRRAGRPANDPGITALSDAEFKSGLPAGFDPNIWAQSPNINNGYPYLRANPPQ